MLLRGLNEDVYVKCLDLGLACSVTYVSVRCDYWPELKCGYKEQKPRGKCGQQTWCVFGGDVRLHKGILHTYPGPAFLFTECLGRQGL